MRKPNDWSNWRSPSAVVWRARCAHARVAVFLSRIGYIERDDKPTKSPINPNTGDFAKSTDASTWGTFDEATAACTQDASLSGVGFVFTADDPYCGVDLDDCRDPDSGQLKDWAREIVDWLASYPEVSPSGTGVKVFVQAVNRAMAVQVRSRKPLADWI
jgi:primase-polymerase (primpol)-like protein